MTLRSENAPHMCECAAVNVCDIVCALVTADFSACVIPVVCNCLNVRKTDIYRERESSRKSVRERESVREK